METMMSDDFCPRQISFLIPGNPGVRVIATEDNGKINFVLDVQDTTSSTGDLRALFFDINEAKLGGLSASGGGGFLTEFRAQANQIIDLGDGATLSGATKTKFDVGLEWGTPGGKKDDINFAVSFTLSNAASNLTLDDIANQRFGAKLDSVGGPGGPRGGATKLLGMAPAAPDAKDDGYSIFEDGAANANTPSKTPTGVIFNVLANDTDADPTDVLRVTGFHDGPAHGTVTISADGKSVIYTPTLDYSGTDSFWYCISDGNGGQDKALLTVNVVAVADDPLITWTIGQGSDINETLITVTAKQNDADGSEYIDALSASVLAGLPAGATLSPDGTNPATQPNQLVQQFIVDTAAMTDYNFNVNFAATSVERGNLDTEGATATQSIVIDYTHNQDTLVYEVVDQSIWSTGNEFRYTLDEFYGVDINKSGGNTFEIAGFDVASYDYSFQLKAGFQVFVDLHGGAIDATIPVDVTVDSTYNKTTDTVYISSITALGSGGSFNTRGPEGALSLDFIFNYNVGARADILGVDIFNLGPYTGNYDTNIISLDSNAPPFVWPVLPGIVDVSVEWPHISVSNAPGTMSGSGLSNNLLAATLDVDGLANALLGGALSWVDSDPTTESNFEVFDVDITGGLKLAQDFAISLAGQSVNLILEDGDTIAMTFGTPITITNASSHDLNGDGTIEFSFALAPNVQLTNETGINAGLTAEVAILRNLGLGDVGSITVFDDSFPIIDATIPIFSDTFALNGVGSKMFDFVI
jgi:Bacterial Ig domain